ncbi:MAG: TfoX/Sxy family protein [Williamsia herbipolensis]|nr:TfoX/Sxy family protein [Williamsia herbipolensis]
MRMFGGVSVMIDDRMAVAAGREGDLLVRIDPARSPEAMARGARQAVMGGGRPMGPGWVRVPPDHLGDDDLGYWLRLGVEAGRSR